MAALGALRDVVLFLLALVGIVVAGTLVLAGPYGWLLLLVGGAALTAMYRTLSTPAGEFASETATCPDCGSPVEYDGTRCSSCDDSWSEEATDVGDGGADEDDQAEAVVEGVHRR